MLYVVLATFAAGMATEYFLGNRWIGFFAVGVPACLYFFYKTNDSVSFTSHNRPCRKWYFFMNIVYIVCIL